MPKLAGRDPVLHYQCAGEGEDVVLIHGLGANLAFWFMSIGRHLARRYRVITYDLRGHGSSGMPRRGYLLSDMLDDLRALLDHLGVARAHVVGHSFGARVALAEAIAEPERVITLTVADTQVRCLQPPTRLRDWQYWPQWKRQLLEMGHATLPEDHEFITYELLVHFNEISAGVTHGALARRARPAHSPSLRRRDMGRKGSLRWARLMSSTTASAEFADERLLTVEKIRGIRAPTLAVFGELSHCLPSCRALQQLIPGCQVAMVPGAGHFHPAVKPRRFALTLERFLAAHPGARSEPTAAAARPERPRAALRPASD